MLNKKTVDDINVNGKRVLVRCDFNVPVKDGVITDENRLVAALPTLKKLIADGGRLILCSHFGKPKEGPEAKYSLAPVAKRLSELLGQEVKFDDEGEVVGPKAKEMAAALQNGEVMLLENTRFRKEETKNVESFSKELASLADVFVNDAFGSAHRAHCSTVGVTEFVETSVVGYLMEKEINFLGNAVENPVRPFAAILGGAKVSDKINVINNLLEKVDVLIIGGGMAYTFMKSQGMEVGKSLLEEDKLDYAKEMIAKAQKNGVKLLLPVDNLVSKEFNNDAPFRVAEGGMEADEMGLDIGPKTRALFADALKDAKTVVWNGPMGVFEMSNFAGGTISVAQTLADLEGATTIIGGGDSAAAVNQLGFGDKMSHISTGGGASLEFLEGKGLPGVDAVNDRTRKKIIAGNWKMNKTPSEAAELVKTLAPIVEPNEKVDVVYCPPFISITTVAGLVKGTDIKVGAENLYVADKGAFTGEISAPMLVDAGCEYVILGHSERRAYFGETDKFINEKVKKAFEYNLKPIICVGETLEQREQGITVDLIRMQTKIALLDVPAEQAKDAVIAYEPVWAIGTGKTATSEQAQEVCHAIRVCLTEMYGEQTAQAMRIQYGGSMNAGNAAELLAMPDIDGGLIGGAALKPDFATIVNAAKA